MLHVMGNLTPSLPNANLYGRMDIKAVRKFAMRD
jgi:hypothetical protein